MLLPEHYVQGTELQFPLPHPLPTKQQHTRAKKGLAEEKQPADCSQALGRQKGQETNQFLEHSTYKCKVSR